MDLRGRVTPYLAEVTHEFGIGSHCAILDGTEIVYIERLRSLSLVSLDLTIGSRLPAYCTAIGRAILAFMDVESVQNIVAKTQMISLTPHTIVEKIAFIVNSNSPVSAVMRLMNRNLSWGKQRWPHQFSTQEMLKEPWDFPFPIHI